MAFSHDGEFLASSSRHGPGQAILWSVAEARELRRVVDLPAGPIALAFPRSRRPVPLAIGRADGVVQMWDARSGRWGLTLPSGTSRGGG